MSEEDAADTWKPAFLHVYITLTVLVIKADDNNLPQLTTRRAVNISNKRRLTLITSHVI